MSEEDPTPELDEVIARAEAGKLPPAALTFAKNARQTVEEILETVESMFNNGLDAPTAAQEEALENIYTGACRWLHRKP